MTSTDLLADAFGRVHDLVHDVLDGVKPDEVLLRVDNAANPIGWLIWHLARVQDDHVAGAAGIDQVWTTQGFYEKFGLPYEPKAHGYGQSKEDVGAFDVTSTDLLLSYHDAVHEQTIAFVETLSDDDLSKVVDKRWDPPVTMSVRLVSVISDALQHVGQAAYVKGLAKRD